jgi:ribosomal protein S18 acetylase RimI-like enzyme
MLLKIRAFGKEDIDFAVTRAVGEGWDCAPTTFRVCLAHDPDGCFFAEADGRRVGMITTTAYEQSGWLGNLIVVPEYRRHGVGRRLMEHAMGRLDARGLQTLWLEADPMGVGIYKRLGFVDAFESPRYYKRPPHAVGQLAADRLMAHDLDAIKELDAACFGDDRSSLLAEFLKIARAAYCVREGGRVTGFAMALPSATGLRLGPCVAETAPVAEQLVATMLSEFKNRAIITAVPGNSEMAARMLESQGFNRVSASLRMRRGYANPSSAPDTIAAMADGAMG